MYKRRLGLRSPSGSLTMAGFKPGGFSAYRDDAPFFHFDLEGRWQRCLIDGPHLLKSLDNRVIEIDRVRQGPNLVLKRRSLNLKEAQELDERVRSEAQTLLTDLKAGRLEILAPPSLGEPLSIDELTRFLERIAAWDESAWTEHQARYQAAYGVDTGLFVPPDLRNAVILRGLAQDFQGHADLVAELLGKRLLQSRIVFIGGSGFLHSSTAHIASCLTIAADRFPLMLGNDRRHVRDQTLDQHRFQAIHAHLDDFADPLPSLEDWRRLRGVGLAKVHLEIESGSPEIRKRAGCAVYENRQLEAVVADLKAAEIDLGLMIPLDNSHSHNPETHERGTTDLLNALELGPRDIISLVASSDMTAEIFADRQSAFRDGLKPLFTKRRAKLAFPMLEET